MYPKLLFVATFALIICSVFHCARSSAQELPKDLDQRVDQIEQQLNQNPQVQKISAGLLQPLYDLAEYMSRPWFYWVAFMLMAAGVVSFALQLVLTKLVLLLRLKLRLSEIFSDALGLLISLAGLVMVTQAAAENSTFTQNAAAVVTAAGAGLVVGFVFYLFGQKTEFDAARDPQVVVQQPRVR